MVCDGLRGGQFGRGAPQALVHLVQVDVVQIGGGQVETAGEELHLGLRGRGERRGELGVRATWRKVSCFHRGEGETGLTNVKTVPTSDNKNVKRVK